MKVDFFQTEEGLNKEALGSGVYLIEIFRNDVYKKLYIGESNYILKRCATHLATMEKSPEKFGIRADEELRFSVIKSHKERNGLLSLKEKKTRCELEKEELKDGTLLQNPGSDRLKKGNLVDIVNAAFE